MVVLLRGKCENKYFGVFSDTFLPAEGHDYCLLALIEIMSKVQVTMIFRVCSSSQFFVMMHMFPICIRNSTYIYVCVSIFSVCSVVLPSHTMNIMANN